MIDTKYFLWGTASLFLGLLCARNCDYQIAESALQTYWGVGAAFFGIGAVALLIASFTQPFNKH